MYKNKFKKRGLLATLSRKAINAVCAKAFAIEKNYMNVVTQNTGTNLDGGEAVKLEHHVREVYSKEIMFKAMPIMLFAQFAKIKTELKNQPGLTISMMSYDNIKKGGKLVEGVRMKSQKMSSSMKHIEVGERGNAIKISELALKSSFTDTIADATTLLSRDVAITLDTELRDVALSATNVIYGRKSDGSKIDKRTDVTKENKMRVATIKDAVEILATNNTPKFSGSYYICFVHPHQSRELRDDPNWVNASQYGAPDQLFTGEIGRIEDTRFIETTVMCNTLAVDEDDVAYSKSLQKATDGTDIYQAILFGEDYYALAVGLPVELRDGGADDFGREHGIAWYSIWGTDKLNSSRGVVIETC